MNIIVIAALFLGYWAADAEETVRLDGLAAYVNDQAITVGDIAAVLQPIERQLRMAYDGVELRRRRAEAWRQALDQAIERKLMLEEFKRIGASVPERAVDEEIAAIVAERFGGDRGAFLDALTEEGLSPDEFRKITRESMAVTLLRRQQVGTRVRVSPAAVRAAYEANIDRYRVAEMVRARVLSLHVGRADEERAVKRMEAERLRAAITAGENFAAVAKAHSEGARAAEGGDLGWISPSALRPELVEVVARLPVGQVSDIIETPDEFFLLLVEGRRTASVRPFEEVRDEIEKELAREEEERLYRRWITMLRDRHTVRVVTPEPPE